LLPNTACSRPHSAKTKDTDIIRLHNLFTGSRFPVISIRPITEALNQRYAARWTIDKTLIQYRRVQSQSAIFD